MEKEEIFLPESEKRETYRLIFIWFHQSRYSRDSLWRHSKLRIELLQSILIAIGPLSFVLVGYISVVEIVEL